MTMSLERSAYISQPSSNLHATSVSVFNIVRKSSFAAKLTKLRASVSRRPRRNRAAAPMSESLEDEYADRESSDAASDDSDAPSDVSDSVSAWLARISGDSPPLLRAVDDGDVDEVEWLLSGDASDVNDTTAGRTPLHAAAVRNAVEIVTLLLAHGASVNLKNRNMETALFGAAGNGALTTATVLISSGALVNERNKSGETPLYASVTFDHIEMVNMLLENGALVDTISIRGETPLMTAVHFSRLEIIACLLENGADVNAKSDKGRTALHVAAEYDYADAGKLLLDARSSTDEKDSKGKTPLFVAAAKDASKMVQLLLDTGASANEKSDFGTTPLRVAVRKGNAKAVRALLSWGVSVNDDSAVSGAESLVILAGREGQMDVLRLLIETGASVNVCGIDGETPLVAIARWDFVDGVELIVAHGASLGSRGDYLGDGDPVIPSTIYALRKLCKSAADSEQIFGRVVSHLEHVCLQVQECNNEVTDAQRSLVTSLAGIIFRACRLLLQCSRERMNMASSLLQERQSLLIKIRDVHEEIGHFVALHGLQHDEPNSWMQWEADRVSPKDRRQESLHVANGKVDTETQEVSDGPSQPSKNANESGNTAETTDAEDAEWFISPDDVNFQNWTMTRKTYPGKVFEGMWKGTQVMVETISMSKCDAAEVATRWFSLNHPHIFKLYGACHTVSKPFFMFEHVPRKSTLLDFLKLDANRHLMWAKLHEAALGLQYLLERGVVHGNLHCKNIVVSVDGRARLAGWDVKFDPHPDWSSPALFGPLTWIPIEVRKGAPASPASDVFALSACIVEAAASLDASQRSAPLADVVEAVQASFSASQWNLVERMRDEDPGQRATIAFVVSQLGAFAAGTESLYTSDADSRIASVESQNIGDTYSPKLDMPINEAIELTTEKCASLPETHWLRNKVNPAVTQIYELIQERNYYENDEAVLRFCALLARVQRHLRIAKSTASVARIARSQKVAESHHVLYADLDRLLNILEIPSSDPIRTWNQSNGEIESRVLRSKLDVVGEAATTTNSVSLVYYDDQASQEFWSTGFLSLSSAETAPSWYLALREVDFTESDCIGKGAFGKAYKGSWMNTPVVIKFMGYEEDAGTVSTKLFLHEVRMWHQLTHPHIVKLYGASHVDKRYFVCEYVPNGNLLEYVKRQHDGTRHVMWKKLHEVALGLQHMHGLGIVHNDLKCDNIMIGVNDEAKLIDFGLSALPGKAEIVVNPRKVGAVHWKSPEYLRGERPAVATDIFSFAMCILEVVTGEVPWGQYALEASVRLFLRKGRTPLRPDTLSDKQWNLVELMVAADASKRVKISFVVDKLLEIAQEEQRQSARAP